ncbi:hypothetical protein L9F63_000817, partial [Diploptera punctata]
MEEMDFKSNQSLIAAQLGKLGFGDGSHVWFKVSNNAPSVHPFPPWKETNQNYRLKYHSCEYFILYFKNLIATQNKTFKVLCTFLATDVEIMIYLEDIIEESNYIAFSEPLPFVKSRNKLWSVSIDPFNKM